MLDVAHQTAHTAEICMVEKEDMNGAFVDALIMEMNARESASTSLRELRLQMMTLRRHPGKVMEMTGIRTVRLKR
jgi:hypothetical protein